MAALTLLVCLASALAAHGSPDLTGLSRERLVLQTQWGDLHLAFYEKVAPKTSEHIRRCGELGLYTTNHFFRVDRGFVAQVADILGGRSAPMSALQQSVAARTLPLEVHPDVKHDKRGILSMARNDDPNSGGSSFSVLLGPAPHLDGRYAVFGEVVEGLETLAKFEELPTRTEGIFVMPLERIAILSTYTYVLESATSPAHSLCTEVLSSVQSRYNAQAAQLERIRKERLPGR